MFMLLLNLNHIIINQVLKTFKRHVFKVEKYTYSKVPDNTVTERQFIVQIRWFIALWILHWPPLNWLWEKNRGVECRIEMSWERLCVRTRVYTHNGRKRGQEMKVEGKQEWHITKKHVFSLKHWLGVNLTRVGETQGIFNMSLYVWVEQEGRQVPRPTSAPSGCLNHLHT